MTKREQMAAALKAAATGPWTPLELADAALAALEEPTYEMEQAGWACVTPMDSWDAMIAAAKEG